MAPYNVCSSVIRLSSTPYSLSIRVLRIRNFGSLTIDSRTDPSPDAVAGVILTFLDKSDKVQASVFYYRVASWSLRSLRANESSLSSTIS